MNLPDKLFSVMMRLQIFISCFAIVTLPGLFAPKYFPNPFELISGIIISLGGINMGILFAGNQRKRYGAIESVVRTGGSPP